MKTIYEYDVLFVPLLYLKPYNFINIDLLTSP